ncbi:MAG: DUF3427 domain-containing protein [Myxococcota bacterium]
MSEKTVSQIQPVVLTDGLYEQVLDTALEQHLVQLCQGGAVVQKQHLDAGDAHLPLTRTLAKIIERRLRAQKGSDKEKLQNQLALSNRILDVLAVEGEDLSAYHLTASQLLGIAGPTRTLREARLPPRPGVPLDQHALLVNAREELRIGAEIKRELLSADRVELLLSFIRWSGFKQIERELHDLLVVRGRPMRVLTTTYMGASEARAIDALASLGAAVRISYDTRRTRLHAKAWLFHRDSGFSTAYVGSSNLSISALQEGLEWNVRLAGAASPQLLDKFSATFEGYWNDPEFEPYRSDRDRDRDRLRRALRVENQTAEDTISGLEVRPYPFQQEILEQLEAERAVHGRYRNLVVAATGTGKTVMAALDYARVRAAEGELRLLFVAHRGQILKQAMRQFREVLRDGSFGELLVEGLRPEHGHHVFASIQSLSARIDSIASDAYDFVIVDEFHHSEAPTYKRLLDRLQPTYLLGLTATPERADGLDVLHHFDGHMPIELRVWDAIDRGLLCPFQYFGLHDGVDLREIQWSRQGYALGALTKLYTAHDARVRLVLEQIKQHIGRPQEMKALGFCVSVAHAKFMAQKFREAGLAAVAVTGLTAPANRTSAIRDLEAGAVQVLFTVDLFNEGVDIPSVDTLLMLRPTQSSTIFLQQLGRGLRLHPGKRSLTILDFIGLHRAEFRFDIAYRALLRCDRRALIEEIEQGFPRLPAGCAMDLDRQSTRIVLHNLRSALNLNVVGYANELIALRQNRQETISLARFLAQTGVELEDLYATTRTWSDIRRKAGDRLTCGPEAHRLKRALKRMLYIDDGEWLADMRTILAAPKPPMRTNGPPRRRVWMMLAELFPPERVGLTETLPLLWQHNTIREELGELLAVLQARRRPLPLRWERDPQVPLALHCRYSLAAIMAAFGRIREGRLHRPREGVLFDERTKCNLLFVTLHKTEKHYSPSTMYEDRAVSLNLFDWQSQNPTTPRSVRGRRHLNHLELGVTPLLFVRTHRRDKRGVTMPYIFLGPVKMVSHHGERPINVRWQLQHEMPSWFFRQARVI